MKTPSNSGATGKLARHGNGVGFALLAMATLMAAVAFECRLTKSQSIPPSSSRSGLIGTIRHFVDGRKVDGNDQTAPVMSSDSWCRYAALK